MKKIDKFFNKEIPNYYLAITIIGGIFISFLAGFVFAYFF